jgi:ankyrin repeat protein
MHDPIFPYEGNGCPSTVRLLLKLGADPDLQDSSGRTALFWAVHHQNYDWKAALLEGDADPNIAEEDGETPLMIAAERATARNGLEIVRMLVEHGADT